VMTSSDLWCEVLDFMPTLVSFIWLNILLINSIQVTFVVMNVNYPWQFGYSVGRHTHAAAVELPSYSLRRVKSADWAYAASAIGLMQGDALYDQLLDYYPCVYWERHCYYYSLCHDMDKAKVFTLREFIALGFRFTRSGKGVVYSLTGYVPVDLDCEAVDPYIMHCMEDWEQHLRARWHQLQSDKGIMFSGRTPSLPVKAKGTYYEIVNVVADELDKITLTK